MNQKYNFVFMGTDQFACLVLDYLDQAGVRPTLIITVPDRPAGRKLILTPPPVKVWATEHELPVLQPANLKDLDLNTLDTKYDLAVVASYGQLIPTKILDFFQRRVLNIHPSLLPRYRGATPLESAILAGDSETGVTIMEIDENMDHGPILDQTKIPLTNQDYFTLRREAAEAGAQLLAEVVPRYLEGRLKPVAQDHPAATYTKKITKAEGELNLSDDPLLNYRQIRAYVDWPGTYFFVDKNGKRQRVIIKQAHLEAGQLIIDRVLPEGKKEMSWEEFSDR
ncbi:MAG: methionyl-tRNA formyltransferase [Candidatus Vogelbacteria bacterium RIFOXYD1_FULL_46_19]|uniref:methionyl-tRNA formyltransferase n=1 Tax=Candidatus Vogelbacteria bacterium RIFOXYD1_FULL_46_19 TaxID=1802439 RepID=A0A1G2QGJ1_9BACT|nr:MAG: methionyl-tRNA formyltransferase [Candidatus Vogelbacteria bacterium RIFOXYD1_FULL_46_19]